MTRAEHRFEECRGEFDKLTAPVNDDPLAQTTIPDLVSAALFELDLQETGGQDPSLTGKQIRELKIFASKWSKETREK